MSEKQRQKKDGVNKNKKLQATHEGRFDAKESKADSDQKERHAGQSRTGAKRSQ